MRAIETRGGDDAMSVTSNEVQYEVQYATQRLPAPTGGEATLVGGLAVPDALARGKASEV